MIKQIFAILFVISLFFHRVSACEDSLIVWQEDYKLGWSDFKGNAPKNEVAESAFIHVKIKTKGEWKDDMPNYKVYTYFNPFKSWTLDSVSMLLLSHEQLHFDIAELYSRKIRKVIWELRNNRENNPDVYVEEINRILQEYVVYQVEYDNQTKHGTSVKKQGEFNSLIRKKLESLEEYKFEY